MIDAKNILVKFKQRWQLLLHIEVLLYALGSAVLVYFLSANLLITLLVFLGISVIAAFIIKPWLPNIESSSSYIDNHIETLEYSTSLLLQPSANLSSLAMLQQQKVVQRLSIEIKKLSPPHHLLRSGMVATTLIIIGFICYQLNISDYFSADKNPINKENVISFQPTDSTDFEAIIPKLINQSLTINYPNYTNISALKSMQMDVKAVEGSSITWKLEVSKTQAVVYIENMENSYTMKIHNSNKRYH